MITRDKSSVKVDDYSCLARSRLPYWKEGTEISLFTVARGLVRIRTPMIVLICGSWKLRDKKGGLSSNRLCSRTEG